MPAAMMFTFAETQVSACVSWTHKDIIHIVNIQTAYLLFLSTRWSKVFQMSLPSSPLNIYRSSWGTTRLSQATQDPELINMLCFRNILSLKPERPASSFICGSSYLKFLTKMSQIGRYLYEPMSRMHILLYHTFDYLNEGTYARKVKYSFFLFRNKYWKLEMVSKITLSAIDKKTFLTAIIFLYSVEFNP